MPRNTQHPRQHGRGARGRADARSPAGTFFTPGASAVRHAIERRSAVPLVVLRRGPRWTTPAVMAALLLAGVAAPQWLGTLAFLTIASFLTWLCYLSWPTLPARGQVLRSVGILVVLAAAAGRATGAL